MNTCVDGKEYFAPLLQSLQNLTWRHKADGDKQAQGSALCPAHDDHRPSLSLSFGNKDGRLILRCWRGCTLSSICEALGIKPRDLFPPEKEGAAKEITAVYDYTDELGNVLYQKIRFEPKQFQMRKNEKCWTVEGIRRVLFRLPNVITNGNRGVLLLEGERDVETAEWMGYVATTSCESSNWIGEYSSVLCPFPIVIIPHNDDKGLCYASTTAESLKDHGCENIKIVELENLGRGGDLTSWVEASTEDANALSRKLGVLIANTMPYAQGSPTFLGIDIRRRMMSLKTEMSRIESLVKELKRCQSKA